MPLHLVAGGEGAFEERLQLAGGLFGVGVDERDGFHRARRAGAVELVDDVVDAGEGFGRVGDEEVVARGENFDGAFLAAADEGFERALDFRRLHVMEGDDLRHAAGKG